MTATTPKFESTTAAVSSLSLPQPVPAYGGGEPKEEFREKEEDTDEERESKEALSDISDEELEDGLKMKEVSVEERPPSVKSSSLPPSEGVEECEDEEDLCNVDEDILYLRLMALRSMIPSSDMPVSRSPDSPSSSNSIEEEMKGLLEEADKAAAANVPPPPIIDIADSDEEKMDLYMKTMTSFLPSPVKKEVKSKSGYQQEPEGEDVSIFYSPTQSPLHLSPPSSPEDIPLPPPVVEMELGSENEAEIQFFRHQKEELPPAPNTTTSTTNTAVTTKNTSSSSRSSNNNNNSNLSLLQPQMLYNCDHYLYQERMIQEQQHHHHHIFPPGEELHLGIPPPPPPLPKAKKRMRKRKSNVKTAMDSTDEDEGGAGRKAAAAQLIILPLPPPPPPESLESEDEEAMRAHLLSTIAAKRNAKAAAAVAINIPPLTDIKPPSNTKPTSTHRKPPHFPKKKKKTISSLPPPILNNISSNNSSNNNCLKSEVGLSFEKLTKYFPNMVRPFFIPLNIPNSSSSDEEEIKSLPANASSSSSSANAFQANLDLLMRNARQESVGVVSKGGKRVPPPKPARKNPPGRSKVSTATAPQGLLLSKKTHPIRKRQQPPQHVFSLVEKESLKTRSSIQHLPLERQKEYKMLLARIAMKEKKGDARKAAAANQDEDPEEMRRLLLSKMKNLKHRIDKNKIDLKKKTESKENSEPANNNSNSNNSLESSSGSTEGQEEARLLLSSSEKELLSSRQCILNELCKLSAQLSQFRGESERLITAQNFLSDLLQQVNETRKLIKKKEERISQLRHVVKLSHLSISKQRKDLGEQERKCRAMGQRLLHPSSPGGSSRSYKLPEKGAAEIKSKLLLIASTAKLCKKVNQDSASSNNAATTSSTTETYSPPSASEVKEISGVSSSIAHLRESGGNAIDPHREFCRFQLLGKCNDDDCPYQHHQHHPSLSVS